MAASFKGTDLNYSSFWHSNLNYASFIDSNIKGIQLLGATLYNATFKNVNVKIAQIKSALSIQDVVLSNRTRIQDKDLINNGEHNCNISHINGWILRSGNVTTLKVGQYNDFCEFTLQSISTNATIYQRVNLSNKWNSTLWSYSYTVLRADMSTGLSMELRAINSTNHVVDYQALSELKYVTHANEISFIYRFYSKA